MEIVVNVKMKINTTYKNATPMSIMEVTKWQIENMRDEATHEVLDWELVEEEPNG